MIRVNVGAGAFERIFSQGPEIRMENRFFEENPAIGEGACLLSRPGSAAFAAAGGFPYLAMFAQHGVFNGDLFIVSSDGLEGRLDRYGASGPSEINGAEELDGIISFAASVGLNYAKLFIASSGPLKYYDVTPSASEAGILGGETVLDDQVIRVGNIYYQILINEEVGDVNDPLADGTITHPYFIYSGGESDPPNQWFTPSLICLSHAINFSGAPGIDYSDTITEPNPLVRADFPVNVTIDTVTQGLIALYPRQPEISGATIPLGVEGGLVAFNSAEETTGGAAYEEITLGGSVGGELLDAIVPEDVDISMVVSLSGFILAIERDSTRFFYIYPGEHTIEALNFESAESEPDNIVGALRVGDIVWLFGESSAEAWYASGDADRPIQRMAGMAFRIGAQPGSPTVVQGKAVFVGSDNVVYMISGGPERISNHGLEERVRKNRDNDGEIRTWSFDLDGHFFYVLSLENQGTYVYDATTQQWHHWYVEGREPFWNMVSGQRWGARILAIDWPQEAVWELQPDSMLDEGVNLIKRVVSGFFPLRDRHSVRNSFVRLYASVGAPDDPDPPPTLSLRFSDTRGKTWEGPYTIALLTIATQDLYFRSLGLIGMPGRIFEITDVGGLVRIDGVYLETH